MLYVTNAFSDNMINWSEHPEITSTTKVVDYDKISSLLIIRHRNDWKSIVGHADTARLLEADLCHAVEIATNRESITIDPANDQLLIGQYIGPRLQEGTSELPEGASIRWLLKYFFNPLHYGTG